MLEVRNLTKNFGGIAAVNNVSFSIGAKENKGEIVGLIGPNGAGKTTLINVITGVHPATSGEVYFEGKNITTQKPWQCAQIGRAHV